MDEISSGILMFGLVRFSLVQNFSPQNNLYLLNIRDEAKEWKIKIFLVFYRKTPQVYEL
jgi:hypothetical protein